MLFADFVRPSQERLQSILAADFVGININMPGKYLLVKGEAPVMLIAHMDTVHTEAVEDICISKNGNVVMSPQGIGGDDRCGVYGIVQAYQRSEQKPWLLFTCDEECGGIGAGKFVRDYAKGVLYPELDQLKWLIELDRKGADDAVFYDCDNPDFTSYVLEKGFRERIGSFSDISIIAPVLNVAAVNLSSGYYAPHCTNEYVKLNELEKVIEKVVEMVRDSCNNSAPVYEYLERSRSRGYLYDFNKRYGAGAYANYLMDEWDNDPECMDLELPVTSRTPMRSSNFMLDSHKCPIPRKILPEYKDLLEHFDAATLDSFRNNYGNGVIYEMWLQICNIEPSNTHWQ